MDLPTRPVDASTVVTAQPSSAGKSDDDSSSDDEQDDDSDSEKYPKNGKQSSTDAGSTDEYANQKNDGLSKSKTLALSYAKISPVGYEHGEPYGTYGRIVFVTPNVSSPSLETDLQVESDSPAPPNALPTSGGRADNVPLIINKSVREGGFGIAGSDETEPTKRSVPGDVREIPSTGSGSQDVTPVAGSVESPVIQLPLVTSVLIKPEVWTAAAADFLRVLEAWVPDANIPELFWNRIYLWGTATAAIVLGVELIRRFRHRAQTHEWDDFP